MIPGGLTFNQRKKFLHYVGKYFWDHPYLYMVIEYNIIRQFVPEAKLLSILEACISSLVGGHHGYARIAHKEFQGGYYWPKIHQDAFDRVTGCDMCQRKGAISRCHELPMTPIMEVKLFYVWGIYFIGPFVSSFGLKYILVVVDYVSKWVDFVALAENDGKSVAGFLKNNIFSRSGTPRAINSDGGSNCYNKLFRTLLAKYGLTNIKW